MKVWVLLRKKQRIDRESMTEYSVPPVWTAEEIGEMLTPVCRELDVSRPMILEKHVDEMERIGRVVFRAADFVDSISFDTMEVELVDEKKRERIDKRDRRLDDF